MWSQFRFVKDVNYEKRKRDQKWRVFARLNILEKCINLTEIAHVIQNEKKLSGLFLIYSFFEKFLAFVTRRRMYVCGPS